MAFPGWFLTRVFVWACSVTSVVSNSLRTYGLQSTWLLCPWGSLGENTEVGCHPLLQGIFPRGWVMSSALQANYLPTEPPGSPVSSCTYANQYLAKDSKGTFFIFVEDFFCVAVSSLEFCFLGLLKSQTLFHSWRSSRLCLGFPFLCSNLESLLEQ